MLRSEKRFPSPRQAAVIKWVNRCGRGLQHLGLNGPRIDTEQLLQRARTNTGLEDYGDLDFREGLDVLIDSVLRESRLSQVGRITFKAALLGELEKRLQLVDYRQRDSRVAEQRIERPLIIAALPRTGSTILYELLAQDPAHRAPSSWEVMFPCPPPQEVGYDQDPRIARAEANLDKLELVAPGFKAIHEAGARLPQECVAIFASAFSSEQWGVQFYCPSFKAWCLQQDMAPVYEWHYRFLQHLQVDFKRTRWLLKTPPHVGHTQALVQRYPDAAIIQTHRDPTEIMGSLSSLACTLQSACSDEIDPPKVAALEISNYAKLLERGMQQRDQMVDAEQRFFDVQFTDLITDPMAVIEQLYQHFNFDLTAETQLNMQRYLANRPRDKHGVHRYSLEEFGLDKTRDGELFAAYRQRFCQPSRHHNAASVMTAGS